ncbi:SSPO protein, partial [Amia calva]|nr:SSPO protein [Amia calva]
DGDWSPWGAWSQCSVPCGGGVRLRLRLCDNPAPQGGGRGCAGGQEQQQECSPQPCTGVSRVCQHGQWNCSLSVCPEEGGLSPWGPWGPCSLSCGGLGQKTRTRDCNHPAPAHGVRDCEGTRLETTYCQTPDCPGTPH